MGVDLLEIVKFDDAMKRTKKGFSSPIMMEFEVNPEVRPYLVSSTRHVQWVTAPSQAGTVRAAVRKRQKMEQDLLSEIINTGRDCEWGNIQPFTATGLRDCLEHVRSYELSPVEVLVSSSTDVETLRIPSDVGHHEASWLSPGSAVVVPVDRAFVGTLWTIGQHKAACLVHNVSRGVAVATNDGELVP